jgi:hypothetical protein
MTVACFWTPPRLRIYNDGGRALLRAQTDRPTSCNVAISYTCTCSSLLTLLLNTSVSDKHKCLGFCKHNINTSLIFITGFFEPKSLTLAGSPLSFQPLSASMFPGNRIPLRCGLFPLRRCHLRVCKVAGERLQPGALCSKTEW